MREARDARGWTQEQLADKGRTRGLTQANISALESRDSLTSTLLFVLADILDVNARWLQTGDGPSGLDKKRPASKPDPMLGQLIDLWSGLDQEGRDALLSNANWLHAKQHPAASRANPFGKQPARTKE